jgi:hypothetical protein
MFNRIKAHGFIAAEISTSHIKLVEISRKGGEFQVENYAIYSRSSEWTSQFSTNPFFTSRDIITTVSDAQVLSQKIRVGKKLSNREKEEAASLAMEKMALCPISELCIDFQTLETQDHATIEILCVAVRRQTIILLQQCFQGTVFKIRKIGLTSQFSSKTDMKLRLHPRISIEQWDKDKADLMQSCYLAMIFPYQQNYLNFLPWRKEKRIKIRQISFTGFMGGCVLVYCVLNQRVELVVAKPERAIQQTVFKPVVVNKMTNKTRMDYSLKNTPIQHFKFLGFMRSSHQCWGVIQTPDGKMYPVKVGDVIGKEQAIVINIAAKKIVLNHHNINKSSRRYVIE